jgi:hypothetical protein
MKFPYSCKTFPRIITLLLAMTPAALHGEPADELIAKGDSYYVKLKAADALKYYLPAEKLEPNNVYLLVRISREFRHLMSDAAQPEQKLSLGSAAVHYAKRAAALQPDDPETQLAVAISYGKLAPLESNREKLEASRIIKVAADKVIQLDPSIDLGWHVLGRLACGISRSKRIRASIGAVRLWQATGVHVRRCRSVLRESDSTQSQPAHALHRAGTRLRAHGKS